MEVSMTFCSKLEGLLPTNPLLTLPPTSLDNCRWFRSAPPPQLPTAAWTTCGVNNAPHVVHTAHRPDGDELFSFSPFLFLGPSGLRGRPPWLSGPLLWRLTPQRCQDLCMWFPIVSAVRNSD